MLLGVNLAAGCQLATPTLPTHEAEAISQQLSEVIEKAISSWAS